MTFGGSARMLGCALPARHACPEVLSGLTSSDFHANENVYSSLRDGTRFAIAFFHEDTDLAELLIALIQQFIGWHIT